MRWRFAAMLLASLCGCGGDGGAGTSGSTITPPASTPTIATPGSTGYFASGDVQLHYQLDLPVAGFGHELGSSSVPWPDIANWLKYEGLN